MISIFEQRLNKSLELILESSDPRDPFGSSYNRQDAEDILFHTVGPLTDTPKWSTREWSSKSAPPTGYEPGAPAPRWTPEQIVYAMAGNPSELFQRGPGSPSGSPVLRNALKIARKMNFANDKQKISDLYQNGLVALSKKMKPGFDEGKSPFISYVLPTVIGAMTSGTGGDKAYVKVLGDDRSKHVGLRAALKINNAEAIEQAANDVQGEYRNKKSHDAAPGNPYGQYSAAYYKSMIKYANALKSENPEAIQDAREQISELISQIEDVNIPVDGASTDNTIKRKDRGAATGDTAILVKALGLGRLMKAGDEGKANQRYMMLMDRIEQLEAKSTGLESQAEKEEIAVLIRSTQALMKAYGSKNADRIKKEEDTAKEIIKAHQEGKKLSVSSADYSGDDETQSMSANLTDKDSQAEDPYDTETINHVLKIALEHDLSSIINKSPKYSAMVRDLAAKNVKVNGPLDSSEFRYIIRGLAQRASNYPGIGVMRSATNVPRDAKGWWKAGEDPEIEPIPHGRGQWNSIWKRNGYNHLGPTEIAQEITNETKEFGKLGIPTARKVVTKTKSTGKKEQSAVVKEAISKMAVMAKINSAKIKLQVIQDIERDNLGLGEDINADRLPSVLMGDSTDKQIIAECCEYIISQIDENLLGNSKIIKKMRKGIHAMKKPLPPQNGDLKQALQYQDKIGKWAQKDTKLEENELGSEGLINATRYLNELGRQAGARVKVRNENMVLVKTKNGIRHFNSIASAMSVLKSMAGISGLGAVQEGSEQTYDLMIDHPEKGMLNYHNQSHRTMAELLLKYGMEPGLLESKDRIIVEPIHAMITPSKEVSADMNSSGLF